MKTLINYSLLLLFVSFFINCSPKSTEPVMMVSADPPSIEVGTFWIGSSRNHAYSDENGAYRIDGFYAVNNKDKVDIDEDGNLKFYFTDSPYDIEFFDSEIENLDYKEGTYYQVEGSKYYLGSTLTGMSVDKVLQTIEDKYYEKVEEKIIFVAPTLESRGSHSGACFKVQNDTYSRSGKWVALCNPIDGFEYESGYLYKLKIRRTHMSKMDAKKSNSDHNFSDELITLLRKQKMLVVKETFK